MSLLTLIPLDSLVSLAAPEELAQLVMPAWAFPLIAAIVFLLLGVISWSYREVAHRHADKTDAAEAAAHQDAHH